MKTVVRAVVRAVVDVLTLVIVAGILVIFVLTVLSMISHAQTANAMTLRQYKDRVVSAVMGDSAVVNNPLSDGQLMNWINDGRDLVAGLTACIQKDTSIITVNQQVNYALPSDFYYLKGVITPPGMSTSDLAGGLRGSAPETPATIGEKPKTIGPIRSYLSWGTPSPTLWVDPAPFGTYTIHAWYGAKPKSLTLDTAQCDLPLPYQIAVVEYAKARAWESLGMEAQKSQAELKFSEYWQQLYALFSEKKTAAPAQAAP